MTDEEDALKAANQQLRASEQQLRAANQQLRASEQQLRAEVAERKQMEEMLRESQERYRALVENTVLGITVIDKDYKITMANTIIAKLFNKPASDCG